MDTRFSQEALAQVRLFSENAPAQSKLLDVRELRQMFEEKHTEVNAKFKGTFKGTTEEQVVKTNSAEIPITIYTPQDVQKDKLVIFFHGGGWVSGSRKSYQNIVNILADATKTIWISVEYRLAPEHKYPIWLDDSADVAQHIIQNKISYGVNERAKIGVAGDSAGGTISASVARSVQNIDFQILIYIGLDFLRETASYGEFQHPMYLLPLDIIDWYLEQAFRSRDDLKDPRVSVLFNTSYEGLPTSLFIVAELDPVRDGNFEYQKRLEKAGVPTKLLLVKGALHGFFSLPGLCPKACAQTVDAIRDFMASL